MKNLLAFFSVVIILLASSINSIFSTERPLVTAWMDDAIPNYRSVSGALIVQRFKDPFYFLRSEIKWNPESTDNDLEPVVVPKGFVTDFASIPPVFWSKLPRDGDYVYAAVVHDYLYWKQSTTRKNADRIFKLIMKEFEIPTVTTNLIYTAVRAAGNGAWEQNKKVKTEGEKRILAKFPDDPKIRWDRWKTRSGVFKNDL